MCTGFEIPALFSSTAAASAGSSLLTAGVAAGATTLGTSAMLGGGLGLLEGGALLGGAALGGGLLEGAAGSAAAGSGSLLGGESLLGGDAGFLGGMGEGIGGGGLDGASSLLDGYSYGDTAAQALGGFGGGGLTAPAASPSIFDTALKYANPAMSIYSGITGLQKQKELERMARLAAADNPAFAALPNVQCPTLGIWGDRDMALTERQMTDSRAFVDGPWRYERFEGIGHWIPEDAPDRLSSLLTEFFA